ncbi:hypothetical protein B0H67DRAFT_555937 [Lasiosphaeris hirsuta]|uniref:Uncharacterized protein n=1 Tax=Lasiosphaeris hirsuta TaxID=260670 RepID=A0AA40DQS4_9PEZI|nr:hypothetical protein B0H67DRAFT_555937 [Lasiosphaeris hirsuta]
MSSNALEAVPYAGPNASAADSSRTNHRAAAQAQANDAPDFIRIISTNCLLWGSHELHTRQVHPTTTIGDAMNLAATCRPFWVPWITQPRLVSIIQALEDIFVNTTIEGVRFSQRATATDDPTTEPIAVAIFDAEQQDELTQASRHPQFFQEQAFAEKYPDFLTSSAAARAVHVKRKVKECSVVATIFWLVVTAYALGHFGGSMVGFQTIVAANIILWWAYVWLK